MKILSKFLCFLTEQMGRTKKADEIPNVFSAGGLIDTC
jgi:hypothetical protein